MDELGRLRSLRLSPMQIVKLAVYVAVPMRPDSSGPSIYLYTYIMYVCVYIFHYISFKLHCGILADVSFGGAPLALALRPGGGHLHEMTESSSSKVKQGLEKVYILNSG